MAAINEISDAARGKKLILDELFDLSLYRELAKIAPPETKKIFDELIPIEERHLRFWQDFFKQAPRDLDIRRRLKLRTLILMSRIFGERGMHLILEAIEVYGIKKYLELWGSYRDEPLGDAVKEILKDELHHEDLVVSKIIEKKISPEGIRNIFLGLNDGLVEITGAVSGFFAAFNNPATVVIAGFTVAIAGSFSMAAGIYAAVNSEKEVRAIEAGKAKFLGLKPKEAGSESSLTSGIVVGASYFVGAMVPVLPVLFGVTTPILSFAAAGILIVLVSFILAFLSGMNIGKRIAMNLAIVTLAVIVTYVVGSLVRTA